MMKTRRTELLLSQGDRTGVLTFGPLDSVLLRIWLLKVKICPPGLPWFSELKTLRGQDEDEDEDQEDDSHSPLRAGIKIQINAS